MSSSVVPSDHRPLAFHVPSFVDTVVVTIVVEKRMLRKATTLPKKKKAQRERELK